ncbi:MAG: hypothetical protein JWP87_2667 [Labilithrix sp.]|nr:hypothetical protein [Labilithrix sp.]
MKRSFSLSVLRVLIVLALFVIAALVACGGEGFDPASKVDSVRLFVVRADKPYAKPGDTVTLEALFTDARKDRPRAAKMYWIPVLCLNPQDDLYYLCFAPPGDGGRQAGDTQLVPIGAAADAGSDGGIGGSNPFASIPTGIDLAPFLPQGNTFSFRIPDDAVKPRKGSEPYGLAIVFNILCAGRVELAERDPSGGVQQVPVLCVGEDGVPLPASDYVIGISRVYAYPDRVNMNPVIEALTFEDKDVAPALGITIEKCLTEKERDCKENKIDIRVSDASWELNPSEVTRDGEIREQIWVDWYSDLGKFDGDARLLFDARQGRISDSEVTFRAPKNPTDGTLWAVVHDNRGGAAWITVPLHVR